MYFAYLKGRAEKDPSESWYSGEIWFYDNYVIPLAGKLQECGVFGVSSDEYLNYAIQNRNEWERKGKQCVEDFKTKCEREARRKGILEPVCSASMSSMNETNQEMPAQEECQDGEEFSASASASSFAIPVTFTAPPGTLGITVDTSKGHPEIYDVDVNSPLAKHVVRGDLIIEIDGVHVRDMSRAALTALMSAKHMQQRNFVVERRPM